MSRDMYPGRPSSTTAAADAALYQAGPLHAARAGQAGALGDPDVYSYAAVAAAAAAAAAAHGCVPFNVDTGGAFCPALQVNSAGTGLCSYRVRGVDGSCAESV